MKRKYGMYFSDFMKAVRTGKNVTLEQLGWGICSVSMMNRIEEGMRLPEKMTRDRLLERLGVTNDGYEDYLQPDEYARWTTRQDLLFAIENDEPDRAWRMIRQYEENARSGNAIESQFYLAMKVQLMRRQEAMEEELRTVLQRAIACTMPEYHMRQWKKCLLSGQEWNLLLEFIRSGGDVGQIAESGWRDSYKAMAYEALLEAVQESGMDIYSRARIGSKAAYYLCAELMKKPGEVWDCERLFHISASAVEVLRSTERMYYLSELLEIEEQALVLLSREFGTVPGSIRELLSTLEQVREWRKVLSQVYRDGGVPERMENDCYLYWQTQNYCYGDVVRKRRKMLGMSVEELCAGICEKRTVQRLESKKSNTQIEIIGELLERLGLSCEYARESVITDRYEAIVLYDEAVSAFVSRMDTDALSRILPRLREMLPMELTINRQQMGFLETLYLYHLKRIEKKECVERLKRILEYTVPLKCIKQDEESYLTCGEMEYLCNIAMKSEGQEKKMYINLLLSACRQLVKDNGIKAYIDTYETFMSNIASFLGDEGEFERSNEISDEIMQECLSMRRMNMLMRCIYNKWWNQRECSADSASIEEKICTEHELQKCIQLARLCKSLIREEFYQNKLKNLQAQ